MSRRFPGAHISREEFCCRCCGQLPPDFYNEENEPSIEYILLFNCFEEIRQIYGKPIPIESGFRCREHSMKLFGDHQISSPISVHLFGLALDLVPPKEDIEKIVKIARLTTPKPRIGWKDYMDEPNPHVHIDLGWLIIPRWSNDLVKGAEW
jgi:hypothetical protein